MAIRYDNDGAPFRLKDKRKVSAWIRRGATDEGFAVGDVAVVFCSRERHLEMNRRYLGHDWPTDVITFDYTDTETKVIGGDIFIDPATVAENALAYGAAPADEMRRVIIHGVLHLCGYGDSTEAEQKAMRAKEDHYLALYDEK